MATLHVRNVPEGLYEALRLRASRNGRSIGAEAVMLLGSELGAEAALVADRIAKGIRRRPSTPFQRFSPRARQVVRDAQTEADGLGAGGVGTEHLLLALLLPPVNAGSAILEAGGIDYEAVRGAVAAADVPDVAGGPFTPVAKQALERALRCCISLGGHVIEPEHLLVGVAEVDALGSRILRDAGLSTSEIVRALVVPPWDFVADGAYQPQAGFRVLQLEGDAGDWESELNSFAARGYSLVEVVGDRAIFAVSMAG